MATAVNGGSSSSMLRSPSWRSRRSHSLLPVDERRAGEIEIEIAEDAAAGQLAGELFQLIEMSGRMAGADDGADRRSGDDVRLDPGFGQRLEDADMGPAARRAAAQRQPDLRLGHVRHLL